MEQLSKYSRRQFIKTAGIGGSAVALSKLGSFSKADLKVRVSGHLWVYANKFPPDWDCTPILETVFSDFKYAGMGGIEVMESLLRHPNAIERMSSLIHKYGVPVTGSSYYGDMWDKSQHNKILEDVAFVTSRLHQVGGTEFGITVGDAERKKTETELDDQAEALQRVIKLCEANGVQPNLHNHTFEVKDDMHDLKGTLARVPNIKLGPDLNWLVRAGIDPVAFIHTYGHQMVYMHLRDQTADGVWTETIGSGKIDFPAIAQALKQVNFKGDAAIELAFDKPPINPLKEDWKISRQYVTKVFGW